MNQLGFPLVSVVLWLPTLGALLLALLPRLSPQAQRTLGIGVAALTFLASLPLAIFFDTTQAGYQFQDNVQWVPFWDIRYAVSVDGLSLWLVLMTTFITPVVLLATAHRRSERLGTYLSLLLLLETATIGVFAAQDMILFYLFFELTLVPTALLIGIFGGANRVQAAQKFFVYTFSGSLFLLVGIIGLYLVHGQRTGTYTSDLAAITASIRGDNGTPLLIDSNLARLLFGALFIGFAVKAPLWPFHTWLPDAHEQAPSDGAVDVLGLLIKTGVYGFVRFNVQLLPAEARWAAPAIGVLAVISILYGAWVAYGQRDMKRLLAYSSVSHVGFLILGVFALTQVGLSGALIQIVNIAIASGALFLIVGMLAERRGSRDLSDFGGWWKATPVLGGLTLVAVLASVGLPGLNGFIGEYTIMQGAWLSDTLGWRFVVAGVIGVVLAAAYLFRMFAGTFMGPMREGVGAVDVSRREAGVLTLLLAVALVGGLYPNLFFTPMQASLEAMARFLVQVVTAGQ